MANRLRQVQAIVQFFVLLSGVAIAIGACQIHLSVGEPRFELGRSPIRILFVGNSLTYYNGGIDHHLKKLEPSLQIQSVSEPGYSFKDHARSEATLNTIRGGNWTYVILQDQSQLPVINPSFTEYYAKVLNQEIRRSGAEPVLMMTWERQDSLAQGVTTKNLSTAYGTLGATLDARVAPVGLAFGLSRQAWPLLELAAPDAHPTLYGTYLAACVLYGFLLERNPVGNPYRDADISADIAAYLQRRAAETLGYED
ncbi:hypothetical protein IQ273_13290 [Nodosilinea sp. LEGE 07298]|uniref:DUF4886 domain-containing protein n=1 Tax=Nodosilinea sp. LEGE 07298 TaxID=2777970 RepID=UPI001881EDBD|nr:DUF4886 domain-containing protein [Nodosilinea sp. LEGE 07298]MBE9110389.1 hypothetical protein [Nodosilinea sp. LEGE 07298]